jgi:hypothetical protein
MNKADEKVMEHTGSSKGMTSVGLTVEVTPKMVVGNEVICEIDAAAGTPRRYVKGGLINLPSGGHYTITFELMPGDVPNLQFDTGDPLWSANTCPSASGNDGQLSPQAPCSATTLDVDATPRPPRNALHYRLNFTQNGAQLYCDPIIINN